ncbi:MAG: aspartate/glutamate racemase family protein [Trueperaceae bacterium]
MKKIGLIGGMSWESSAEYYRIINEATRNTLGELYSARSLMATVNFDEIKRMQYENRWAEAAKILAEEARSLERGGADCIVLCTNTMHKLANDIQAAVKIPFIHIADATAEKIQSAGLKRIGLLGTIFTMEHDFYKGRLTEKYGLEVLVPHEGDRQTINTIIYQELVQGKVIERSKAEYVRIMKQLIADGAEGIILGCTEIMLLVSQKDSSVPVFDTTTLHALAAVEFAIGQPSKLS